jgi:DNA-binding NtrC family response regulator
VIRELIREILAHAGYETVGAESADEALELIAADDLSLVVSDIVMPGLTGLELLQRVREMRPGLPVILVTGAGTYENLSEAVTRGADGLVIKPFSHAELRNAVAGALERGPQTGADVRDRLLRGKQWDPALVDVLVDLIDAGEVLAQGDGQRNVLLVVDDDEACEAAVAIESVENVRVVRAPDARGAADLCRSSRWSLAVIGERISDGSGLDLLETIRERAPSMPVVMLTDAGSEEVAIEAFRRGAADYVVKSDGYLDALGERVRLLLDAA